MCILSYYYYYNFLTRFIHFLIRIDELLYTDIAAHAVHAISSVNCKQSVNALFARNATKSFNAKYAGDAVNSMKTETAMKAGEVNFAYKAKHATYATFAMYAVHRHYQQTGRCSDMN